MCLSRLDPLDPQICSNLQSTSGLQAKSRIHQLNEPKQFSVSMARKAWLLTSSKVFLTTIEITATKAVHMTIQFKPQSNVAGDSRKARQGFGQRSASHPPHFACQTTYQKLRSTSQPMGLPFYAKH